MELNSFYDLYANNWISNLLLVIISTLIAFILAHLLPVIDNKICKKVGLSLQGGLNTGKRALLFKWVRRGALFGAFLVYLFLLIYLVLLVRTENPNYVVRNAGFSLFTMTFQGIELPAEEFIEFYLNIMIFIPMGYLLPYLFRWFRIHAIRRPLIASFVISIAIENLQLLTKRGSYDTSDVISNTLGGAIGIFLFIFRAYRLTNPEWKKDYRNYRRYRKLAKRGILFPFTKKLNIRRVTIEASNEEQVWDFYSKKMGLQLVKLIVPQDSNECYFLFRIGKTQLEILCHNNSTMAIPNQQITFSYENLDIIKSRLTKAGVDGGEYIIDPYTNHRILKITAPDDVILSFIEL